MRSHRPSLADVAREMGVRDERLLKAIGEVPRATFVPQGLVDLADEDVPSRSGMRRSRPNRPWSRAWWRRCACGEPRSCSRWKRLRLPDGAAGPYLALRMGSGTVARPRRHG